MTDEGSTFCCNESALHMVHQAIAMARSWQLVRVNAMWAMIAGLSWTTFTSRKPIVVLSQKRRVAP